MTQAQVPQVVADYFGPMVDHRADHPIISAIFHPGRGWISQAGYRKRVSVSWVRKLANQGVTAIALTRGRRTADFQVDEILGRRPQLLAPEVTDAPTARVLAALVPQTWVVPSAVARKVKIPTHDAWLALEALKAEGRVRTDGNGCWTKYQLVEAR